MRIERRTSDDPATIVISQDPAPGDFVHDGDRITVVVSRGPPPVTLPKVENVPVLEAQLALTNKGFVVTTAEVYNDTIVAGNVVSTDPAGLAKAPRESTIKLLVSKGPTPVPVPDVSGGTCDSATQALTQAGFKATCDQVFSETVAAGKVVNTDPPANTALQRDTAVTVHVSKGPERIQVPNVVGMPLEAASQRLQAAGFQVAVPNYKPGGKVKAMAPAAGNLAKRGDTVTLYL
jgi:serine/threonine-protein kinase